MNIKIDENIKDTQFKLGYAGYILDDGSFSYVDEYHADDYDNERYLDYPEFSNTHAEDDTCIRLYKEPNDIQYEKLEMIIDKYLDREGYCKIEVWKGHEEGYSFYKIFSLWEGACDDCTQEELVGNWSGYKLIQIIKNYFNNSLTESLLTEATRSQLIQKSKTSDNYKDPSRAGENRYTRRTKSSIAATVADYNNIDMNAFFKGDILDFGVRVRGETNNYIVKVTFEGVLKELQQEVTRNNNLLEFRSVVRAIMNVFNRQDVYVSCQCPDWKYRQEYWATMGRYNSGTPQTSNGMRIVNPNDTKGAGCKHVNLVLSNLNWAIKIASTVHNYIKYCKENMQYNYATYIFPVIYGKQYQEVIQMSVFDYNPDGTVKTDLIDDEATLNLANAIGKVSGRYRTGITLAGQNKFQKKPEEDQNLLNLQFDKE